MTQRLSMLAPVSQASEEVLSLADPGKEGPSQLQLRLSSLEAVQLLNKEWAVVGGKADPFLVFKVGGQTLKTLTVSDHPFTCVFMRLEMI